MLTTPHMSKKGVRRKMYLSEETTQRRLWRPAKSHRTRITKAAAVQNMNSSTKPTRAQPGAHVPGSIAEAPVLSCHLPAPGQSSRWMPRDHSEALYIGVCYALGELSLSYKPQSLPKEDCPMTLHTTTVTS